MTIVKSQVFVKWVESTLIVGSDSRGRPIVIGGKPGEEPEWVGVKASDLLLLAAAACSTYDVVTILAKQREPLEGLEVECSGDQNSKPPYAFTSIHLRYLVKGDVNPEKLERAIRLSEEKYCSVISTLRPTVGITSEYEIMK